MRLRHLDYDEHRPVRELGAAGIDALLDRGEMTDWQELAAAVRADPEGDLAETVLRLCAHHDMYGTSSLWTTWIEGLRARSVEGRCPAATLAELRREAGFTQEQVAERIGSTQSDVSKLEHRPDVRVSTLRSYAAALGGMLEIRVRLPGVSSRKLSLGEDR